MIRKVQCFQDGQEFLRGSLIHNSTPFFSKLVLGGEEVGAAGVPSGINHPDCEPLQDQAALRKFPPSSTTLPSFLEFFLAEPKQQFPKTRLSVPALNRLQTTPTDLTREATDSNIRTAIPGIPQKEQTVFDCCISTSVTLSTRDRNQI